MKKIRIIVLSVIILITLSHHVMADESMTIYGVKVHLKNNKSLDGYILTYTGLLECYNSKEQRYIAKEDCDRWKLFLQNEREQQTISNDIRTVEFIRKLVKLNYKYGPNFLAAKSSIKQIKIDDIKSIKDVHRKWNGIEVSAFYSIPEITDKMADFATNHKMIASYTFNHEDVSHDDKDYAFGTCTTYISYNPEYSRKRLIKERKLIDKMSADKLDENKLIRFRWAYD